jgi:hypothetical protein
VLELLGVGGWEMGRPETEGFKGGRIGARRQNRSKFRDRLVGWSGWGDWGRGGEQCQG